MTGPIGGWGSFGRVLTTWGLRTSGRMFQVRARGISGFSGNGMPPDMPGDVQRSIKQIVSRPHGDRDIVRESPDIAAILSRLHAEGGGYYGWRDYSSSSSLEPFHAWGMYRHGDTVTSPADVETRTWFERNNLNAMGTTLLRGSTFMTGREADLRAASNTRGIMSSIMDKFNPRESLRADAPRLYLTIEDGARLGLGTSQVVVVQAPYRMEYGNGGVAFICLNVVAADHVFSGNLTWIRGISPEGRVFTLVFGEGADIVPFLQPVGNMVGGTLLFAVSNDVMDRLMDPKNMALRDNLAELAWNGDQLRAIESQLDPSSRAVKLCLEGMDTCGTILKRFKNTDAVRRMLSKPEVTDNQMEAFTRDLDGFARDYFASPARPLVTPADAVALRDASAADVRAVAAELGKAPSDLLDVGASPPRGLSPEERAAWDANAADPLPARGLPDLMSDGLSSFGQSLAALRRFAPDLTPDAARAFQSAEAHHAELAEKIEAARGDLAAGRIDEAGFVAATQSDFTHFAADLAVVNRAVSARVTGQLAATLSDAVATTQRVQEGIAETVAREDPVEDGWPDREEE